MDEERLGRRLQAARVQAGMTQQVLCQRAGLSYSTLTKIERGAIKSPSIFTIQRIAGALGVQLDALMGNSQAAPPPAKKRSLSGASFVYFDVNGCLVQFFTRAFTAIAEETGAPPDLVEATFWHYNDQLCRGDITLAAFNRVLAKQLGAPAVDWLSHYLEAVEPMPGVADLVRWAAEHYRVGLLTNITPGALPLMRQRHVLPDVAYDVVVDSSEAKHIKPEAAIYELAARLAACPAHEILLIDDSRVNLMAAEKQGWHVLWFDDSRPAESIARARSALAFAA